MPGPNLVSGDASLGYMRDKLARCNAHACIMVQCDATAMSMQYRPVITGSYGQTNEIVIMPWETKSFHYDQIGYLSVDAQRSITVKINFLTVRHGGKCQPQATWNLGSRPVKLY